MEEFSGNSPPLRNASSGVGRLLRFSTSAEGFLDNLQTICRARSSGLSTKYGRGGSWSLGLVTGGEGLMGPIFAAAWL